MVFDKNSKAILITGFTLLLLAVAFGAFGAHGLEKMLAENHLKTFKTGVTYQFYHSFSLILLGIIAQLTQKKWNSSFLFYLIGILLFSFNCYIYALTQIKFFAMIVPIGGISFMIAHTTVIYRLIKG